jgi:hypothetical protein
MLQCEHSLEATEENQETVVPTPLFLNGRAIAQATNDRDGPGFHPTSGHVGFMVDLYQRGGLSPSTRVCPVFLSCHQPHTTFISHRRRIACLPR